MILNISPYGRRTVFDSRWLLLLKRIASFRGRREGEALATAQGSLRQKHRQPDRRESCPGAMA